MLYFYEMDNGKRILRKLELNNLDKLSAVNHQKWLKKEIQKDGVEPVSVVLALVK